MRVSIRGLTVGYRDGKSIVGALDSIDLELAAGQSVAVMGGSGSGKSTLLRAIKQLVAPLAGTVSFAYAPDQRDFSQRISLVLQRPESASWGDTVDEDIGFALRLKGMSEAAVLSRSVWALEQVGLDADFLVRDPLTLSGGQQRCAAIAASLAIGPDLLLLDEPTAGLDARARRNVVAGLQSVARAGVGIVVVTHSWRDACELCTRLLVLDSGSIAYDGPVLPLFSSKEASANVGLDQPFAARVLQEYGLRRGEAVPSACEPVAVADALAELVGGNQ